MGLAWPGLAWTNQLSAFAISTMLYFLSISKLQSRALKPQCVQSICFPYALKLQSSKLKPQSFKTTRFHYMLPLQSSELKPQCFKTICIPAGWKAVMNIDVKSKNNNYFVCVCFTTCCFVTICMLIWTLEYVLQNITLCVGFYWSPTP